MTNDTIVAKATPTGRGSVGILRVSGCMAKAAAQSILGTLPKPRNASYLPFLDKDKSVIDKGIALYFPAPNSFTGEDVLELQGHGGDVVLDMLLEHILSLPHIRMANPGEFSQRAFLNDKIDLTQAEAIADLIDASSKEAVKSAMSSLQGVFSKKIDALVTSITNLRIFVEASIDFPEEEIDFLSDGKIKADLEQIIVILNQVLHEAKQGAVLRDGMKVVIAGKPNAGKSSLLNALAGNDVAIVTEIAGTTRDVMREHIQIDGMPLHIIDTAGLRESNDEVERIGIERAYNEISKADRILFMIDGSSLVNNAVDLLPNSIKNMAKEIPITIIINKIDKIDKSICYNFDDFNVIKISAKTGQGIETLRDHLKQVMGYVTTTEGGFIARRRHLQAINEALVHLQNGRVQLLQFKAGELLAEELRLAQESLSEITGKMNADALLGKIFGSFCIGK